MRIVLGALAALAILAGPAMADTAPAAQANAQASVQPDAKKLALVHRYIADTKLESLINSLGNQMVGAMSAQMLDAQKGMKPAEKTAVQQAIQETMAEEFPTFSKKMIGAIEPVYAEAFSEQELTELVAFYESPTGRSLIEKTPQVAQRTNQLLLAFVPEFQQRVQASMVKRLCAKGYCPPAQSKDKKDK